MSNKTQQAIQALLEKGGKRAFIGEIRVFAGRKHIKTTSGWKFYGNGTGEKAKSHQSLHNTEKTVDNSKKPKTKFGIVQIGGLDLNLDDIAQICKEDYDSTNKELIEIFKDPIKFNNGYCDKLVEAMEKKYGGKVKSVDSDSMPGPVPYHVFLKIGKKFYDMENPEGVDSPKLLNFFKRKMSDDDEEILGEGSSGTATATKDGTVRKQYRETPNPDVLAQYKKIEGKKTKHFVNVIKVDSKSIEMEKLNTNHPLIKDIEIAERTLFNRGLDEFTIIEETLESPYIQAKLNNIPKGKREIVDWYIDKILEIEKEASKLGIKVDDYHSGNFGVDKDNNLRMFDFKKG